MRKGPPRKATSQKQFNDQDVLEAFFRLEVATDWHESARKLFLRTYVLADDQKRIWHATPEEEWPLLAIVLPDKIVMRPIHVNPHAKRYLSPKNGRFTTVIYADDAGDDALNEPIALTNRIQARLAWRLFDSPERGLGLTKEFDLLWLGLSRIQDVTVLVISDNEETHAEGDTVSINTNEMDKLRRTFAQMTTKGRRLVRQAKEDAVRNHIFARLTPEQLDRAAPASPRAPDIFRTGTTLSSTSARVERRTHVQSVRAHLVELTTEAPQELMMLHAEIERVTLSKMISAFEAKLSTIQNESRWQKFFEQNKFILSVAFARPVELAHTQFHAKGSTITGEGAHIGDFLFTEFGQALAIVEIKTPDSPLLKRSPYRGRDVFGPNSELSGAVTQVLFQQSELRQRWLTHANDSPRLRRSGSDVIKCVVIAGRLPADPLELRSFEVFRNACKDVDIVTFDELLAKLKLIESRLAPSISP